MLRPTILPATQCKGSYIVAVMPLIYLFVVLVQDVYSKICYAINL